LRLQKAAPNIGLPLAEKRKSADARGEILGNKCNAQTANFCWILKQKLI